LARNDPVPVAARNNIAPPNAPTDAAAPLCTSSSTSSELRPKTIRCAANPERVAATVGRFSTVRMPCIQPVITA
jgi:hypothetical protein